MRNKLNIPLTPMASITLSRIYVLVTLTVLPGLAHPLDAPVEITLSKQVQDELKKSSPIRKERLKKAIEVGNELFTQMLDNTAYNETYSDTAMWVEKTGKLLAMEAVEFHNLASEWRDRFEACQNITLVDLKETMNDKAYISYGNSGHRRGRYKETLNGEGEVELRYQATKIGRLIFDQGEENDGIVHFDPRMKGNLHWTVLRIDTHNKVADIITQDQLAPPEVYKKSQSAPQSLEDIRPSSVYQDDTLARAQARADSHNRVTKEMEQVANEVCASSVNTITKEK